MNRRTFLSTLAAGSALRGAAPQMPNIVFILADDLGHGDVGCYGATKTRTPNMDRLAAQGIRFTDAHSASAVCTPTRYGIMTGRYSWRTRLKKGVLLGYDEPLLEPGRLTVPALLKRKGYTTGGVGKWHLGLQWARKDPSKPPSEENTDFSKPITNGPLQHGFDSYFGISASLDMPPYMYIENDRAIGQPTGWVNKAGAVRAGVRDPQFEMVKVLPDLVSHAVDFIDRQTGPFFLYLPLTAPHTPVVPAPAFKGKSQVGDYGDFVAQTDDALGQVMAALDHTGAAANTLLIFTSDNGGSNLPFKEFAHNSNAPWRGRKSDIWDGGHRIPFLARWPGRIASHMTCAEPICLNDLLATAAAVTGQKLGRNEGEDSYNILPALEGRKGSKPIREAVVHHSSDGMFAIRQWPWKLVEGRGSGGWDGKGAPTDPPGQLYDLEKDPAEKNNLYEQRPETVQRLAALLDKYRKSGRSRS